MQHGREGDPVVLVLDRLDTIIDLLGISIGLSPSPDATRYFPGLERLLQSGQTPAEQARHANRLLEYLVAASLPSSPQNARAVTVGTTEELLASNESQPLMRVDISNMNVAQPLVVNKRGVSVNSGIQVLARQTIPFVLPPGAQIYGIVALGTILVTVTDGFDMRPMLDSLFTAGA